MVFCGLSINSVRYHSDSKIDKSVWHAWMIDRLPVVFRSAEHLRTAAARRLRPPFACFLRAIVYHRDQAFFPPASDRPLTERGEHGA